MKISLILPMYNEEKNIITLIDDVRDALKTYDYEAICVDDGSSDGTMKVLSKFSRDKRIKVIAHEKNMGVGAALRTGLKNSSGDVVIFMESDHSQNPYQIPRFIKKMRGGYDLVMGSRFLEDSELIKTDAIKTVISKVSNPVLRKMIGANVKDITCGFRAMQRKSALALDLQSDGFDVMSEMLAKAVRKRYKITEVPITMRKRKYGKSNLRTLSVTMKTFKTVLKSRYL